MIDRLNSAANRLPPGELEQVIGLAERLAADEPGSVDGTPPPAAEPAASQPSVEPSAIDNTAPVVSNTVASSSDQPSVDAPVTVPPAETPATDAGPVAGADVPEPAPTASDGTPPAGTVSADVVDQVLDLLERASGVLRDATGKEDGNAPT